MVIARVIECHLCGYARMDCEDGRMFDEACACLTPECQGERGDECELVLLCTDCL